MRRKRFPVLLSARERRALKALAQEDGLSGSAVIRRLVRQEAGRRGLLESAGQRQRDVCTQTAIGDRGG